MTTKTLVTPPPPTADAAVEHLLDRIRKAAPALTERHRRGLLDALATIVINAEARALENHR